MPPDFAPNQPETGNPKPGTPLTRLFIYGTLKRGGSNHRYMNGQRFVDVARTVPAYRLFDMGGFPGMVPADDGNGLSINGEVWDVTDECLNALDVLEAVDEGEYLYEVVPLLPPFDKEHVMGYRYARSVAGRPDISPVWPV